MRCKKSSLLWVDFPYASRLVAGENGVLPELDQNLL
jgi:hypothetical protein